MGGYLFFDVVVFKAPHRPFKQPTWLEGYHKALLALLTKRFMITISFYILSKTSAVYTSVFMSPISGGLFIELSTPKGRYLTSIITKLKKVYFSIISSEVPFSGAEKHPHFGATLCFHFVTTNVKFYC